MWLYSALATEEVPMVQIPTLEEDIPVSAPINTDSTGKAGDIAEESVVRVICTDRGSGGTGFLHFSGKIITAAHVVKNCSTPKIVVLPSTGGPISVSSVVADDELDLALLSLAKPMTSKAFYISKNVNVKVGSQVSTWGFPGGYSGRKPLLSVGYLSGMDGRKSSSGSVIKRWVVNAAFNLGNSGGPLINIEDGSVVGVVSSKLAPMPPDIESAIQALTNQKAGFQYTVTRPDGSTFNVSEGQVVAMVLEHLRSQTQLVIGHAVLLDDVRSFLKKHGVKP
jgi:S1-C subfamily serine protease